MVGDGLVPSRVELVNAPNTGRDKPVPYKDNPICVALAAPTAKRQTSAGSP